MSSEAQIRSRLDYTGKLLTALGNGLDWEYSGQVIDMGNEGKCTCGHKIRNGYVINRKDNKKIIRILGSECINVFQTINPELHQTLLAALENEKLRVAEDKKQQKALFQDTQIAELKSQYVVLLDSITQVYNEYREQGRRVPYKIYCTERGCKYRDCYGEVKIKAYKSKAALIKWFEAGIVNLTNILKGE